MYGKMQTSGLTEFIPFVCTSAVWGQSCFIRSWQIATSCIPWLLSSHYWWWVGGSIWWTAVLGALIHIWRPEITDGCDLSCLLIWQETVSVTPL